MWQKILPKPVLHDWILLLKLTLTHVLHKRKPSCNFSIFIVYIKTFWNQIKLITEISASVRGAHLHSKCYFRQESTAFYNGGNKNNFLQWTISAFKIWKANKKEKETEYFNKYTYYLNFETMSIVKTATLKSDINIEQLISALR